MPLPKTLARFNLVVTNPILGHAAKRLPGFAIVTHVGRRTGREHQTPVNLFRARDSFVIALTYGSDAQWVRNVLAAGSCTVLTRGRRIALTGPRVVRDPRRRHVPAPVRPILAAFRVDEFMLLVRTERGQDRATIATPGGTGPTARMAVSKTAGWGSIPWSPA
jgi:deazaflavin-dependent oxidoreductase (nitroreductase family)